MVGQACYSVINSMDYMIQFNNSRLHDDDRDEDYAKLLLLMPMIKREHNEKDNWNFKLGNKNTELCWWVKNARIIQMYI